jgi:predicted TIM-barrel fold metal-dependent hydrolase
MSQIIDTHAHIYDPNETRYPKIAQPLRPPEGTGDIRHLRQEMAAAGVARAVLIQTGTAYRWDNRLLADSARAHADWAVGVCTLDPAAPESVTELERLVAGFNVKGLRMEPARLDRTLVRRTLVRPPTFDHPAARRLWAAAQRLKVVLCAHIRSSFIDELAALLADFPEVPVVLDHAAYPRAAEGVESATVTRVAGLARFPNLNLKLTFAVTGSDEDYPFPDMHPILWRFIEAFGPDRCMWGSDFPCELWLKGKATYRSHLSLYTEALGLSENEQRSILWTTPMRIWFPDEQSSSNRGPEEGTR